MSCYLCPVIYSSYQFIMLCVILYLSSLAEFKVNNKMQTNKPIVYLGFVNNPFGPSNNIGLQGNMDSNIIGENITFPIIADLVDGSNTETTVKRSKRGVLQLYNMVKCATGCNPFIYKGYGCYCGFLGSGRTVDGIDRCCKRHDWCYNNAGCQPFFEYLAPYYWTCFHNRPLCALNQDNSCVHRLCECDRLLSECLSQYPCPQSRALCRTSPWRLIQNALMIF